MVVQFQFSGTAPPPVHSTVATSLATSLTLNHLLSLSDMETKRLRVQAVLLAESKQVPVWKVACMVGLFAWLLVTALVKGHVRCGSPAYWILVVSIVPPVLFLLYQVTGILVHKRAIKDQVRAPGALAVCGIGLPW